MRAPLLALALLVATVVAVRPWSIARSAATERCYATWPRTTGIYQLDTDAVDVIQGVLEVDRLDTAGAWTVPQTGGIAIVQDSMLGVTLLFGIEPVAGQIVRYTLDEHTAGTVSKLSDRMVILSGLSAPEALAFDAAGETVCVTYTHASTGVHMARCYRISRQPSVLSHNGIDEWWTSVGYYPYAASSSSPLAPIQSLSAIGFDAHARPLEHATRSLWIDHAWDTQRRVMTRFPLVRDGSSTPESTEIYHDGPAPTDSAEHIVWQFAPDTGLFSVLSEEYDPVAGLPTLFATAWTADSQPRIQRLSLDPQTLGTAAHKHIAMWLAAVFDPSQLIDLQMSGTASLSYDRTPQAIALGYASPSPSVSASRAPDTPSQSPVPSRIATSPSRFPDLVIPPPQPSLFETKVEETIAEPQHHGRHARRSWAGLWALATIVPLCCCAVALVAVRKRRALAAPFVYGGSLHNKAVATFSLLGSDSHVEEYDIGTQVDMNLIPIARHSTQAS